MVNDERRSRRSVLAAAGGAAAALSAFALAQPARALAVDGEPLLLGDENTASSLTTLTRTVVPDGQAATFLAENTISAAVVGHATSGPGIVGRSQTGTGVQGYSETDAGLNGFGVLGLWAGGDAVGVHGNGPGIGVVGLSVDHSTGVIGASGGALGAEPAARAKTGVLGQATQDTTARGVWGISTVGQGVRGEATSGTGGAFTSTTGHALSTSGRVRFSKISGIAVMAAGTASKTITPGVELTSTSFVLLTPRGNLGSRGLWYTVDTTTDRFTIRVSSAVAASVSIGWLLLG